MRTDLELLRILLEELKLAGYFTGLCYLVRFSPTFLNEEKDRLFQIIYDNKPSETVELSYYWPESTKAPRIVFLESLIYKLEAQS